MVLVGDWDATPASFVSLFPVYYFDIDDISKASFTWVLVWEWNGL